MKALGEAASELPWLVPGSAALLALSRTETAWDTLRFDPGALLLLVAATANRPDSVRVPDEAVLERALERLRQSEDRCVDWDEPGPDFIHRQCLRHAALAHTLAGRLPRCDADQAWIGGLLAPLGWLAICAAAPGRVAQHLRDFVQSGYRSTWQHQAWGLDTSAIARRLSRRWGLPSWLAATAGCLGLPLEIALPLGADAVIFQVVQLAVALNQRHEHGLALPVGAAVNDLLRSLDLSSNEVGQTVNRTACEIPQAGSLRLRNSGRWKFPGKKELLIEVLQFALETRRSRHDELHAQKMAALAELAAGAGHEINNPLAVICGQAQYVERQLEQARSLIPEEPELAHYLDALEAGIGQSLKTIFSQSQRIHQVLLDLRQFARPNRPRPQTALVRDLLRDAAQAVQGLAEAKKVRLVCPDVPETWHIKVDLTQTRTALTGLLRNAVEAAPQSGWAGLRAETAGIDTLTLVVEDNGPGPDADVQKHMFDPFYSGRCAGRGRGLGLPVAWRLVREQGGDLRFDGHQGGITRFVLSLPCLQAGPSERMKQPA